MAENKRYYWLKLHDDFFNSKRIKKLRKLAGGDTYTIIYLKMQLKALKTGGVLEYSGIEESFAEEIALDIDEEPDNVAITISYLLKTGLMITNDEINYALPYVEQCTGSETASAQRVRDFRAKTLQCNTEALQCNTDVTEVKQLCNVEKEIEIEKRRERKELQQEKSEKNISSVPENIENLLSDWTEEDEIAFQKANRKG